MLGALARALRLSDTERDHLYRVGGAPTPTDTVVSQHIAPGVQRLLDRLVDLPIGVFSAAWDLLWWNPLWAALTGDPGLLHGLERNAAWRHFTKAPAVMHFDDQHAHEFADDLMADLREAVVRYPQDRGLAKLVHRLRADCPDIAHRWNQARIARHRSSRKTATGAAVGPITIDCDVLTVPGTDLRIVVYSVVPGSADASKLALLSVTGTQAMTS